MKVIIKQMIDGWFGLGEDSKLHKKKNMTIKMKSEPLKSSQGGLDHPITNKKVKERDYKKKGTRGSSWIG